MKWRFCFYIAIGALVISTMMMTKMMMMDHAYPLLSKTVIRAGILKSSITSITTSSSSMERNAVLASTSTNRNDVRTVQEMIVSGSKKFLICRISSRIWIPDNEHLGPSTFFGRFAKSFHNC